MFACIFKVSKVASNFLRLLRLLAKRGSERRECQSALQLKPGAAPRTSTRLYAHTRTGPSHLRRPRQNAQARDLVNLRKSRTHLGRVTQISLIRVSHAVKSKKARAAKKAQDASAALDALPIDTAAIFVDGASRGNGTTGARAAWGMSVHIHGIEVLDGSAPLSACEPHTNIRAEMHGVLQALDAVHALRAHLLAAGAKEVVIYTDSKFTIDVATKWGAQWEARGWRLGSSRDGPPAAVVIGRRKGANTGGGAPKNLDLVQQLVPRMRIAQADTVLPVRLQFIRSHQTKRTWRALGNKRADALATAAADSLPIQSEAEICFDADARV